MFFRISFHSNKRKAWNYCPLFQELNFYDKSNMWNLRGFTSLKLPILITNNFYFMYLSL